MLTLIQVFSRLI